MVVVSRSTPDSLFISSVFALKVGECFKYAMDTDYETVYKRVHSLKPTSILFEVVYVEPGTSYYTEFGANTVIVVKNQTA